MYSSLVIPEISSDSVDDIVGSLSILEISLNSEEFREWITEYHKKDEFNEYLGGYKFFILTAAQILFSDIHTDTGLKLQEDTQYNMAHKKGVPIDDILNSCEKARLLKRMWIEVKKINRIAEWDNIDIFSFKFREIISAIRNDILTRISVKNKMEKLEAIKWISVDKLITFFNDTIRGYPLGALKCDCNDIPLDKIYLDQIFDGYVLTLQFVYYKTLGSDFFNRSILTDLHRPMIRWSSRKDPNIIPSTFIDQSGNIVRSGLPIQFSNRRFSSKSLNKYISSSGIFGINWSERTISELKDDYQPSDKWIACDEMGRRFLNTLKESDSELKRMLESFPDNIMFDGKLEISPYMAGIILPNPSYLENRDEQSKMKQLDASLLWYDMDVLDTLGFHQFNGALSLISLLKGYSVFRKENGKDDSLYIRIFQHPEGVYDDYSFGVLMEVYGSNGIGDYSGWMVFFDCASNSSPKKYSNLKLVESCIGEIKSDVPLDLKTIVIEKDLFKKYLIRKSISPVFETIIIQDEVGNTQQINLPELRKMSKDVFENAKGKLFEYAFSIINKKSNPGNKFDIDITINGEQIDAVMYNDNKIYVYECKINIHKDTLEETLSSINRKVNALKIEMDGYTISPTLVIYSSTPGDRKEYFENQGILVIDNYREKISNDTTYLIGLKSSKKQLLKILDLNMDAFLPFG